MRYGLLGPLEVVGVDGKSVALERATVSGFWRRCRRRVRTWWLPTAPGPPMPCGATSLRLRPGTPCRFTCRGCARSWLLARLAGTFCARESSGYRLTVAPGELDVQLFESLVGEDGGGPNEASSRLQKALDLWRGPALADVSSPLLVGEAARLEALRLAAIQRRIEADLARGCHAGNPVPELESLVHDHPLREGLRGELMRALYRSGRQADALAVYRRGWVALAHQLGIDPSPALQGLELAILQQSPDLDVPDRRVHSGRKASPAPAPPIPQRASEPDHQRRRRRRTGLLLAVVGLLVISTIAGVTVARRGTAGPSGLARTRWAAVHARTNRWLASFR